MLLCAARQAPPGWICGICLSRPVRTLFSSATGADFAGNCEESSAMFESKLMTTLLAISMVAVLAGSRPALSQEIIILGSMDQTIGWLKERDWWGEEKRDTQLTVPHAMLAAYGSAWPSDAQAIPVADKKELFYRMMLPLIMHANAMVTAERANLESYKKQLLAGGVLSAKSLDDLRELVPLLRIADEETAAELGDSRDKLLEVIDESLYRLDIIPAGLALGQAAYESGYGTSRFAVKGNALFGQWTYGDQGMPPEQRRKGLGKYGIATFDWPFDSVRGYFLNLSSHPAYEDFRRLRARLRSEGKPLTSLVLADGLARYSERGQEYVDALKAMIRVNHLEMADNAIFREEPISFIVGARDDAEAEKMRSEIVTLKESGELAQIIDSMKLE